MRIALINTIRHYGGGEKRVLRGAEEFSQRGHDVLVLGRPEGELLLRCREEGFRTAGVPPWRYYLPSALVPVARELRAFGADIVVTYDERAVRIAALAAGMARSEPPVPVVHYYGLEGAFKNKPYNRLVVAPRITRVVANAEAIRQELLSFGWIPPERLSVIYDGVDPAPIERADPSGLRQELGAGRKDVVFLVVARLVPEKGHDFLLEALAPLVPRHPRLKVWIAGRGPEGERVRARLGELRLGGSVRMLGFRPDVPRLLRAADVLCHPSRREGAPNAVREGMAAGLPVVAVAASGTPELVVHGQTGLLSPVGELDALRENIQSLLASAELRQQMGSAGRERARIDFSEELCHTRWLELLSACTNGNGLNGHHGPGSNGKCG